MDQKMKKFDRSIEKMMNEHEVTPPFGMWNRIAAELETGATPVPVSVNSPIPQRTVFGFIAGALLISASMMTAYLVNEHANKENSIPSTGAIATQLPVVSTVTETPVVVFREEAKPVTRKSKAKLTAVRVEHTTVNESMTASIPALPAHSEVSVPTQTITQNNVAAEVYYFPAIDVNTAQNKAEEKATASIAKVAKVDGKTTEDNDREISSYEPPRIKFRPKKHRSFSYGKIIHRR